MNSELSRWTKEQRMLFKEKLGEFGKRFDKISACLKGKSSQDCVFYFYINKHKYGFRKHIHRMAKKRRISNQSKDIEIADLSQRVSILNYKPLSNETTTSKQDEKHCEIEAITANTSMNEITVKFDVDEEMKEEYESNPVVRDQFVVKRESELLLVDDSTRLFKVKESTPRLTSKLGGSQWTPQLKMIFMNTLELVGLNYKQLSESSGESVAACKSFYQLYKTGLKLDQVALNANIEVCLERRQSDKEVEHCIKSLNEKKKEAPKKKRGRKKATEDIELVAPTMSVDIDDEDISKRTVSYWSVAEKNIFLKCLAKYGTLFDDSN